MSQISRKASILMVVVAASITLPGCALFRNRDIPEQPYEERSVEVLYGVAGQLMDTGAFPQSIQYFREVERQHPATEWARRSILMSAFAAYRMGSYDEAIFEAERYIQLYPGSPPAAYAAYLRAISYYEQIVDVGRDQAATERAQQALREVTVRFPSTDYARDARLKLDQVDDHLAGKEMTVGRFYLRRGDTLAAVNRFKTVIDRFETTSHAPEALYRLVEAYLTLGVIEEANRNAAVLGANFPGSDWYADAYALMTSRGQTLDTRPTGQRRLRNLFGILPGGERDEPLPVNPEATIRPPVEEEPAAAAAGEEEVSEAEPARRRGLRNLFGILPGGRQDDAADAQ